MTRTLQEEQRTEHPDSKRVVDAMLERLRYLEVNDDPWPGETRALLWQVYCAAGRVAPDTGGTP